MESNILEGLAEFWDILVAKSPLIIVALVVMILFYFFGKIVSAIFKRFLGKRWKDQIVSGFVARALRWTFYIIGLLSALHILGFGALANSLLAGAGISAVLVGFAFRDIAENFISGVMLAFNRPFNVSDIIEVNGFKGTVKSLDLRHTYIRNSAGRDIFIPNSTIVKNVLINYTRDGLLRMDFDVDVEIDTDIQKMRKLIITYLLDQPDVLKDPQPNVLTFDIDALSIKNKITFWVDILEDPLIKTETLGEPVKGRVIREINQILRKNEVKVAAPVVSHRVYNPE